MFKAHAAGASRNMRQYGKWKHQTKLEHQPKTKARVPWTPYAPLNASDGRRHRRLPRALAPIVEGGRGELDSSKLEGRVPHHAHLETENPFQNSPQTRSNFYK